MNIVPNFFIGLASGLLLGMVAVIFGVSGLSDTGVQVSLSEGFAMEPLRFCYSDRSIVAVHDYVTFIAPGCDSNCQWNSVGAYPAYGNGGTFRVQYFSPGQYTATVRIPDGSMLSCAVTVSPPTVSPDVSPTVPPDVSPGVPPVVYGYINVISPNGGESLEKGQKYMIRWESSPNVSKVYIKLRKGNDTASIGGDVTGGEIPNTGSYLWKIPSNLPSGKDYQIRVVGRYADGRLGPLDDSDVYFSITDSLIRPLPSQFIKLMFPVGGEILAKGKSYTIKWKSSPGVKKVAIYLVKGDSVVNVITKSGIAAQGYYNLEGPDGSTGWE